MTNEPSRESHARRRGEHGRIALVLAIGLVLAAGVAYAGWHAGGGHGDFGHHSPRLVREFMEFKVDRALQEVDATPEQRRQIESIVGQAFERHSGHREDHRALHRQASELLTAETIDRAQLEALRSAQLQRFDAISRDLVDTVVEVAEILAPEQRRRLVELHQQRFE